MACDRRARPATAARTAASRQVARTPIMGCFREAVSIRVTPDGEGSRVDIRSSSRYFEAISQQRRARYQTDGKGYQQRRHNAKR